MLSSASISNNLDHGPHFCNGSRNRLFDLAVIMIPEVLVLSDSSQLCACNLGGLLILSPPLPPFPTSLGEKRSAEIECQPAPGQRGKGPWGRVRGRRGAGGGWEDYRAPSFSRENFCFSHPGRQLTSSNIQWYLPSAALLQEFALTSFKRLGRSRQPPSKPCEGCSVL